MRAGGVGCRYGGRGVGRPSTPRYPVHPQAVWHGAEVAGMFVPNTESTMREVVTASIVITLDSLGRNI